MQLMVSPLLPKKRTGLNTILVFWLLLSNSLAGEVVAVAARSVVAASVAMASFHVDRMAKVSPVWCGVRVGAATLCVAAPVVLVAVAAYISLTVTAVVVPSRTTGVGSLSNWPSGQPKVSLLILMPLSAVMVALPSVMNLPSGPPTMPLGLEVYLQVPMIGTPMSLNAALLSLILNVTLGRAPSKLT